MGFCFGFLFEKARVFEPVSIRGQFVFAQWTMMKMYAPCYAACKIQAC